MYDCCDNESVLIYAFTSIQKVLLPIDYAHSSHNFHIVDVLEGKRGALMVSMSHYMYDSCFKVALTILVHKVLPPAVLMTLFESLESRL